MLSSVPPWINEFGITNETTRQKVWDFLNEQSGYPYNIVNKNCQHFAYDFFRYKLKKEWLQIGGGGEHFHAFTEALQQGGWQIACHFRHEFLWKALSMKD